MTNKPSKELSRRDALKLLGAAAGASVLANLPSKWSTPHSVAGVLPAHAQTSAFACGTWQLQIVPRNLAPPLFFQDFAGNFLTPDAGGAGLAAWDCSHECLLVVVRVTGAPGVPGIFMDFTVTPFDGPSFGVSVTDPNFWWIYLDASTGTYSTGTTSNFDAPPGSSCPSIA